MKLRFLFLFLLLLILPAQTHAAVKVVTKPIEVSGWIPYWRTATGTADALAHIDTFTEISPFGYTVKRDGSLFDAMKIGSSSIADLVRVAQAKKIKIIPSVMWSDADAIETILKDKVSRTAHVKAIVAMVKSNGFDGVDIDYEGKHASTRPYFSAFLKELYYAIGAKPLVVCTIESRTPVADAFDRIPTTIDYANDLPSINKYCDRVRVMTYDQGRIDLRLNASSTPPYAPVSDVRWVEKVIRLMSKDINKNKISIGIPTYGYEYEITQNPSGSLAYKLKWSFNPRYATDIAMAQGITPIRNNSGELSFTYTPTTTTAIIPTTTDPVLNNNTQGGEAASTSNNIYTPTNVSSQPVVTPPQRFVTWSDASAIKDKVDLAKRLGVRGVAVFKIDGGEDAAMWNVLK